MLLSNIVTNYLAQALRLSIAMLSYALNWLVAPGRARSEEDSAQ